MTLVAGTRTLSSFTFKTGGTRTITATDAGGTLTANTSANVTVNAGAAPKLQILLPGEVAAPGTATGKTAATPTAQTAGTAIANGIVVNAVDANWNLVSTATTNVTITSSDSTATTAVDTLSLHDALPILAGTRTLSSFTFKTSGTRTVTATDAAGTLTANTSPSVTVVAGAFAKLQLLVPGETASPGSAAGKTGTPTARTAGTALSVTINAVDDFWNLVSSATHNVSLASSDTNAVLPAATALSLG